MTSCEDDDAIIPQVEFNVDQPTMGQMYGLNDTIYIEGSLVSDHQLHGYELFIRNKTADSVVFSAHGHEDMNTIHFIKIWINDVKHHSDMELVIDAFIDHEGTKQTKVIDFHCHPM